MPAPCPELVELLAGFIALAQDPEYQAQRQAQPHQPKVNPAQQTSA